MPASSHANGIRDGLSAELFQSENLFQGRVYISSGPTPHIKHVFEVLLLQEPGSIVHLDEVHVATIEGIFQR